MAQSQTDTGGDLVADNLTVALSWRTILKNVSLSVAPGEVMCVIGANGAGKSTLLRTMSGLLPPVAGCVRIDGQDIVTLDRRHRAREIAYLPQDRIVHWPLRVIDVVALGRIPHRSFAAAPNAADHRAIDDAMRRMDVVPLAQRPIASLSGGERARVLIARALAQEARYIIADEPTAGLDPAHSLRVFAEFKRLSAMGVGIVTAVHDLSLAARFADRMTVLQVGTCLAVGTPAKVLSTTMLQQAFEIEAVVTEIDGYPIVLPTHPLQSDAGTR